MNIVYLKKMTNDWNTVSLLFIAFVCEINCIAPGYSYTKFMGPVSGPEKKVLYDNGKYHQHDYVAKPDYHFAYGVEDPKSKVHQSRQETRHGDTVEGQYSVLDPDGSLRTVKYTADKLNGFQASVITDGHVVHHPQDPVQPIYHNPPEVVPHQPEGPQEPPLKSAPPPKEPEYEDDEYSEPNDNDGQGEQGEDGEEESEEEDNSEYAGSEELADSDYY